MRISPDATRRAILLPFAAALISTSVPGAALAGERGTAQTVGLDTGSLIIDPRALNAERGLIWGGRERCDPTDVACTQGGELITAAGELPPPKRPVGYEVTDRLKMSFVVAGEPAGDVVVALWRPAAPTATDAFVRLGRGMLTTGENEEPASLERSTAVRILRNEAVVLGALRKPGGSTLLVAGQTRPQRVPVAPPKYDDENNLSHDAAGWLSVRRGGGSFEFVLTPRANPALDREWLIIGQVEEGMGLVERLNTLPTNNYDRAPLATVQLRSVTVL
mmetsp:Transcript_31611/g.101413  ORF Transcript_31611/g.101413 Transcript_31611/m.101413 type:complete len:277 (-) Transcript_31611:131-961(-)